MTVLEDDIFVAYEKLRQKSSRTSNTRYSCEAVEESQAPLGQTRLNDANGGSEPPLPLEGTVDTDRYTRTPGHCAEEQINTSGGVGVDDGRSDGVSDHGSDGPGNTERSHRHAVRESKIVTIDGAAEDATPGSFPGLLVLSPVAHSAEGVDAENVGEELSPGSRSPRLSERAPVPLLVFDTDTFRALGELDQRFLYQGGVAEWVSRARPWQSDDPTGSVNDVDGRRHDCAISPTSRGPGFRQSRREDIGGVSLTQRVSDCAGIRGGAVVYVHERNWAKRHTRKRRVLREKRERQNDDDAGARDDGDKYTARPSRNTLFHPLNGDIDVIAARRTPGEADVGKHNGDGEMESRAGGHLHLLLRSENVSDVGVGYLHGFRGYTDSVQEGGVKVDQWNCLPPEDLERLVQADADLFFLPWLMQTQSSGSGEQRGFFFVKVGISLFLFTSYFALSSDAR